MEELSSGASAGARGNKFDVVIVGAGFAGLYALHELRRAGMSVRVLEAGSGVGGTWFWNRYPGARCDTESMDYSYSFSDELQQEWHWSERYAPQPEILRYINHVADRFDLRRDIEFDTRVTSASFDDSTALWTITASHDTTLHARFVIMATGCLSLPRMPEFPGRDSFEGSIHHTGLWPNEGVDFTGQRVGVIGTGSSGIQVIPQIAAQAEHLWVFQRTPNFSLPARNREMQPEYESDYKNNYSHWRTRARQSSAGMAAHPIPTQTAFEASPEERQQAYEDAWARGGTGFTKTYTDLLTNRDANETAASFVRKKIRATVKDPAVAEMLTPRDHFIGTKRICLDTGYYETYNRANVTLIDVRKSPILQIAPEGLQTADATYPLDAIVFATGFDAVTGALLGIDIRGSGGERLEAKWAAGAVTYLGLMTAGFPNLFFVTGPGSPSVLTNMVGSIELHIDWIVRCLVDLREKRVARIEAAPESERDWVAHVNEAADATLFPLAASWYMGANVPGKPRVFLPYIGGHANYRRKTDEVAADGYRGFVLTS